MVWPTVRTPSAGWAHWRPMFSTACLVGCRVINPHHNPIPGHTRAQGRRGHKAPIPLDPSLRIEKWDRDTLFGELCMQGWRCLHSAGAAPTLHSQLARQERPSFMSEPTLFCCFVGPCTARPLRHALPPSATSWSQAATPRRCDPQTALLPPCSALLWRVCYRGHHPERDARADRGAGGRRPRLRGGHRLGGRWAALRVFCVCGVVWAYDSMVLPGWQVGHVF